MTICVALGLPRIPLFGSYLLMLILNRHHLQKAADLLTKRNKPNIISLYLGSAPTIIVNGESQRRQSQRRTFYVREFDGKPDILAAQMRDRDFNIHGRSDILKSTTCTNAIPEKINKYFV